jgi:hypothetical protein
MPDASVNIGGDASGAIAAVAAAQGAIDGLTGKTVHINIETRGGGAGGGLAGAASGLAEVGNQAERAGRRTRDLGGDLDRAGRGAQNLGSHFARAGDGAARAADQARPVVAEDKVDDRVDVMHVR